MRSDARIALLSAMVLAALIPPMLACKRDFCEPQTVGAASDQEYACECCHGPGCVFPGEKRKTWSHDKVCAISADEATRSVTAWLVAKEKKGTSDWSCVCVRGPALLLSDTYAGGDTTDTGWTIGD